ncbi:MAG: hypothetical protein V1708_00395 [Candidatus Micrarchaeota archaeon]
MAERRFAAQYSPKRQSLAQEKAEIGALAGTASIAERIPWGPIVLVALALFALTVFDAKIQRGVIAGITGGYCGDGYCSSAETPLSCPADCAIATPTAEPSAGPEPAATPVPKVFVLENEASRLGLSNIDYREAIDGSMAGFGANWVAMAFNSEFPDEAALAAVQDRHVNVVAVLSAGKAYSSDELAKTVAQYAGRAGRPVIKYYLIDAVAGLEKIKQAYNGVKKGCPDCRLVVSLEPANIEFVNALAAQCANGCFDAIGLKEYDEANRSRLRYLSIAGDFAAIKAIYASKRLSGKAIWVSELGVFGGRYGNDYRKTQLQAGLLARSVAVALASGAEKVFLGHPAGCYGTSDAYYCSVAVAPSGGETTAFDTLRKLKNSLEFANFSHAIALATGKLGYAFSAPTGMQYVAWNDDSIISYSSLGFGTPAKKIRVTDLITQQSAESDVKGGKVSTVLREDSPLLIEQIG